MYLVEKPNKTNILYCYILAWILKLTMLLDLFFIIVDINNKLVVGIFVVRCLKEPIVVKRECFWWLVNFLLIVKILHKFMYIYIYKLIILKSKWIALLCNNTVYLTHCCTWGCRYLQHRKILLLLREMTIMIKYEIYKIRMYMNIDPLK